MSTTPKRTQPARRKSTGEVFSTPATPTRGGFVSPSRTASTSKKRKRGAGIASPNPPGRSPRSKHLLFDPSTGQYRVATPQVERELRRSQREKIREIFLTAEFYKSQSRRTPLKRRKVDDGRFVDPDENDYEHDYAELGHPADDEHEFAPHHGGDEDDDSQGALANPRNPRRQPKAAGRDNRSSDGEDEPPPARANRRASTARRALVLDPPENDDDDHEIPHDDEQDAVPPQRRRAPTQTRANGARAPVLDEEVSPDWRSIGQRASSKIDSEPGSVAILSWDANGRITVKKVANIPAMSAISASSNAVAMISKQDKKLYYADMDALESGEALQPFAPFSDLSCLMVEIRSDRLAAVFEDGRAAICLLGNHEVKFFAIQGDNITKCQLFDNAIALLTASGAVFIAGWPTMVFGLDPVGDNILNDFSRQEWDPRRLETLREIVSISFSDRHALALNRRGECFAFGVNGEGQLGLGEDAGAFVDTPTKVPSLRAIVQISAGMFQSAFLDATGQLYTCGSGKHMTTAQSHQETLYEPTRVQNIDGKSPQEVIISTSFSGFQFSVVTAWGRVFTCGFDALSFAPGRDNDKWNATLHLLRACAHLSATQVSGKLPFMALLLSESYTHVIADEDDD